MSIRDILLNPILGAVANVMGIITFVIGVVVSLTKSRKWLLQHSNTKWIIGIPWALLLVLIGVVIGVSVGVKYQDTYLGLFIVFAILSLGLGIQWLQSGLLLSRFKIAYNQLTNQYNDLVKIVDRLQKVEFTISNWSISNTVYENGDSRLKEELTIVPIAEPVIYYYVAYKIFPDASGNGIEFSVKNSSDGTPLPFFEIATSEQSVTYMIVLDPPSLKAEPKRILIECKRKRVWSHLITHGQGSGSINVDYKPDVIKLELIAPPDTKWRVLRPAPVVGEVKLEAFDSRAIWNIQKPTLKEYNYSVFLESTSSKSV